MDLILKLLIFFPEEVKLGCLFQSQKLLILSVVCEETIVVLLKLWFFLFLLYCFRFSFHCLSFLFIISLGALFMLSNFSVHLFEICSGFFEFLYLLIVICFNLKLWVHLLELHHLGLRLLSAHCTSRTLLYLQLFFLIFWLVLPNWLSWLLLDLLLFCAFPIDLWGRRCATHIKF